MWARTRVHDQAVIFPACATAPDKTLLWGFSQEGLSLLIPPSNSLSHWVLDPGDTCGIGSGGSRWLLVARACLQALLAITW